jgi:hypothetical protein
VEEFLKSGDKTNFTLINELGIKLSNDYKKTSDPKIPNLMNDLLSIPGFLDWKYN